MPTPFEMSLPLGFFQWAPPFQALTLAVLTLVQEDTPTVAAALLSAAGSLSWRTAFLGCFLGIWLGDAMLYAAARLLGRPILGRSWARHFSDPAGVTRTEQWFARQGNWLLFSSRFVPGTRLPTYLAAGFLRLPFPRFLVVTGVAVVLWTTLLFVAARSLGEGLFTVVGQRGWSGWSLLLAGALIVVGIRGLANILQGRSWRRIQAWVVRWSRWEFWPPWLFYIPVGLYYFFLAVRYRGLTLPTMANPGMFSGGLVGESKSAILDELTATSPEFTAQAHLLQGSNAMEKMAHLDELCRTGRIEYPFVLKPDVGQRGVGVKLIRIREQAAEYLRDTRAPLIAQQYAPGPNEVGVFYYRFPTEAHGRIFAITEKIFPTLVGDGVNTIEELIWRDPRCRLIADMYLRRLGARRLNVPSAGESVRLVETGNHAQGCIFRNGTHLWSEDLERCIDEISGQLDGFFIGRYDIRYANAEDLRAGRDFQIVELNGAASEATSIYDARNSLWAAYRTLFRQWRLVFEIGAANQRLGSKPTEASLLLRRWHEIVARIPTYPVSD
jgi:membrane protein DedA with SNARE-associated domain